MRVSIGAIRIHPMKFAQYASFIIGILSLAIGYLAEGHVSSSHWILGLGAGWLFAEIRRARWASSLGFLACLTAAGYGLWIGLPPGWMLSGAFGGLMVWSLSDFQLRVLKSAPEEEVAGLARRHLLRLGIVTTVGMGFSLFGLFFRFDFSFEWVAFLGILSALGVAYLIGRIRRGEG